MSLTVIMIQLLTRSSLAQTCDLDCCPPSLIHLNDGEVDLACHIFVPAVSFQSRVFVRCSLSDCKGQAAAVSSQRSAVTGKNNRISGLSSLGSCAPMTFCGLPPGVVESQFLDE